MPSWGKSRLFAIPAISLVSLTALSGCVSSEASSPKVGEASGVTSAEASASDTAVSSETPDVTASSTASSTQTATPKSIDAPEGYKPVTAPGNNLVFAIPEDWISLDNSALTDATALNEFVGKLSQESALPRARVEEVLTPSDLLAMATSKKGTVFIESLIVKSEPEKLDALPSESDVSERVTTDGVVPNEYKVVETPLGKAVKQTYTVDIDGTYVYGVLLIVPSGKEEGSYSSITISSATKARSSEIADAVAQSLDKAS